MNWKYNITCGNAWKYLIACANDWKYNVVSSSPELIDIEDAKTPILIYSSTFVLIELPEAMNFTYLVTGQTPTKDNFTLYADGEEVPLLGFVVAGTYGAYYLQVLFAINPATSVLFTDTLTFSYSGMTWMTASGKFVKSYVNEPIRNLLLDFDYNYLTSNVPQFLTDNILTESVIHVG